MKSSPSTEAASAETGMVRRILVPVNLTGLGERKAQIVRAQARAFGAEVLLLHVIPSAPPNDSQVTVTESQALTYLDALAAGLRAEGVEAHALVRFGRVQDVIVEEALTQQADMAVLGSNVRRGLANRFLGSIAEDVVANIHCPVLLVQPNLAEVEEVRPVRSFDEDVARVGPVLQRHLGQRTVALGRIVGSVGRAADLDASFRSTNRSLAEEQRYQRILKLMEEGAPLPPISLYKLGYGYYVLDGNHRVAAAKHLGQLELEADVVEFVPMRDPQAQRLFVERRAFEQATGLTAIGCARPGHYPRLEQMVRDYAKAKGASDLYEAAREWEARVYRPVVRQIRAKRLGHFFPDQRTADVFVRISDFRNEESAREGREVSWEEAVERFRRSRVRRQA